MFRIEAIGNLGGDAEVKQDNGRSYVQFSVADTRRFKKEDGTETEITNWISCFMRNTDSEVIKYLKKGTRVFVRGNGDLRLFSSAKDRMMKAGASINVSEIELVGGQSESVPRELAIPETGQLVPVYKAYYIDITKLDTRPSFLADRRGVLYSCDANGFVFPPSQDVAADTQEAATEPQSGDSNSEQTNTNQDNEQTKGKKK